MASACGTPAFTNENENFFRYTSILLDLGTDVLREIFKSYFMPKTLTAYLATQQVMKVLESLFHQNILQEDQRELLYPKVGYPDLKKFDITLLYFLIRNLGQVNSNKLVWKNPSPKDTSIEANVARLRNARNILHGHVVSARISDKLFQAESEKLEQVIVAIIKQLQTNMTILDVERRIKKIKESPLEEKRQQELISRLNMWYALDLPLELQAIKEDLAESRRQHEQLEAHLQSTKEDTRTILNLLTGAAEVRKVSSFLPDPGELRRQIKKAQVETRVRDTAMMLKTHKEQQSLYGIRLKSFEEAIRILKDTRHLFLTGGPGIGKSFMAKTLLIELSELDVNIKPLRIYSASEWTQLVDPDEKLCVFVDDFLGRYGIEQKDLNDWRSISDIIIPCLATGNVQMIATIRSPLMKQIADPKSSHLSEFSTDDLDKLISSSSVLDLTSSEHEMTRGEKERMLLRYIHVDGVKLTQNMISNICDLKNFIGFPQSCRMMKAASAESGTVSSFEPPADFALKEVDRLYTYSRIQYATLVVTMLSGGTLHVEDFYAESQRIISILRCCGLPAETAADIVTSADHLCDVYLSRDSKYQFTFLHDSIYAIVFKSFCSRFCQITMQLGPLEILSKIVCGSDSMDEAQTTTKDTWEIFVLQDKYFPLIEQRFIDALKTKEPELFQVVAEGFIWSSPAFQDSICKNHGFIEVLDFTDVIGNSILVHASAVGNKCLVARILRYIDSVAADNASWCASQVHRALVVACKNQKVDIVESLLTLIHKSPDDVMFQAAEVGNVKIMQMLVEKEGTIDCKRNLDEDKEVLFMRDSGTECLLHVACLHGREDMVRYLLDEAKIAIDIPKDHRLTPLHFAAAGGNVNILKRLIDHGFNPNSTDEIGANILHFASVYGKKDMVKFLCSKYPDMIRSKGYLASEPIHSAAGGGSIKVFEHLVKMGADPRARRNDGGGVLFQACKYGMEEMSRFLIATYPDLLQLKDDDGWTAFHSAVLGGDLNIISHVLQEESDLSVTTRDGRTALHIASQNGNEDVVKMLVSRRPLLVHEKDNFGWTPLHCAVFGRSLKAFKYLIRHNTINYGKTKNCESVLDIARRLKQEDILSYLEINCDRTKQRVSYK